MFDRTIDQLADAGVQRADHARTRPLSFLVGSAMAGAYVGFGAILMFTVGAHADPAWARLVMGAVFALGLTLITFAGGHLFTGYAMQMALAWLRRKATGGEVLAALARCWFGNLVGAVVLAAIFKLAGGGVLLTDGADLFYRTAAAKANAPAVTLLFKAILCNWLVCLTVWMCARTSSDSARLGLVFWPVMMFAACGFEHSIANMFTFALALLGNAIGGMLMVATGYWIQSQAALAPRSPAKAAPAPLPER